MDDLEQANRIAQDEAYNKRALAEQEKLAKAYLARQDKEVK